jgi:GTP cyclohydrolase IA
VNDLYGLQASEISNIDNSVRSILWDIGDDPTREGLLNTPARSAKAWAELTRGLREDPNELFTTFDAGGYDEMIIVDDIPFVSLCEHHLLPFMGVAHIGYIPDGKILGLSKFARVVQLCAAKPHVQEKLTMEVADLIDEYLKPLGVIVVMKAEHSCMAIRGVKTIGSKTITSAPRGVFLDPAKGARAEFLQLIQGGK